MLVAGAGDPALEDRTMKRTLLALSRRYPLWWALGPIVLMVSPSRARDVARWLEYRMNLYDGIEG